MNLVDLVFEELEHNRKREATRRRRKGLCVGCGCLEDSHSWSRDGAPCGTPGCRCEDFHA